jgi:alpha-1,3-rhamnosyl/mannosyltransferase
VAGRRVLPPTTRALRSAGLTLDSFLLRGAEIGAAGAGERVGGESVGRAVFHTAGGAVPIGSRLPVVATLLDLAPWELPQLYASHAAARLGHRLRARVLRDAARVIVCARATAETAGRALHLPAERLAVVPLAVADEFRSAGRDATRVAAARERLALPARYLCFSGRYDARKDVSTLFDAIRTVRASERRGTNGPRDVTVLFAIDESATEDAALIDQALARHGLGNAFRVVRTSTPAERAAVIAGAEAFVYPALSEATAWHALEALSVGVPVICSGAGALPETVGSAGIVVAPRDAGRLAAAIEAVWDGGALAAQLRRQALRRADSWTRTWSDVAHETRAVYAAAAR